MIHRPPSWFPTLVYCCSRDEILLFFRIGNRFNSWKSRNDIFPKNSGLLEQYVCNIMVEKIKESRKVQTHDSKRFSEHLSQVNECFSDRSIMYDLSPGLTSTSDVVKQLLFDRLSLFPVIDNSFSLHNDRILQTIMDHLYPFVIKSFEFFSQANQLFQRRENARIQVFHEELSMPLTRFLWFNQSVLMKLPKSRLWIPGSFNLPNKSPITTAVFSDASLSSDLAQENSSDFSSTFHWIDLLLLILNNSGVKIVIAQQSIHPQLLQALHKCNIATITNISIKYLQPVLNLTGATAISSVVHLLQFTKDGNNHKMIPADYLGVLKKVSLQYLYRDCFIVCEGLTPDSFKSHSARSQYTDENQQFFQSAYLKINPILTVLIGGDDDRRNVSQLFSIVQDSLWFLMKVLNRECPFFLRADYNLQVKLEEVTSIEKEVFEFLLSLSSHRLSNQMQLLPLHCPAFTQLLHSLSLLLDQHPTSQIEE